MSRYHSLADAILTARTGDPHADRMRGWRNAADTAIQSAAAAVAYLLLALSQMGLGAVWMTGPTQAAGEIARILGMPSDTSLAALVPVGYPGEDTSPPPRRPVDEVCRILRWRSSPVSPARMFTNTQCY